MMTLQVSLSVAVARYLSACFCCLSLWVFWTPGHLLALLRLQMGHEAGQSASEAGLSILKPSMLFSPQSEMSETRQGRTSSTGDEEENLAILRR